MHDVAARWRIDPVTACIKWPHAVNKQGYGLATHGGRGVRAHRFILGLAVGPPLVAGLDAAHSCHNPGCVNPAHLRWATRQQNMDDGREEGRFAHGSRAGKAKFTEASVRESRSMFAAGGWTVAALARHYGVSPPGMAAVLKRRHWRHV